MPYAGQFRPQTSLTAAPLLPGPVVIQLRIEMGELVSSRSSAAHQNSPRRLGAKAGWLLLGAITMPEGKNRAKDQVLQLLATAGVGAVLEAATQQEHQTRSRRIRCSGTSRLDRPCASRRSWPTSATIWNWKSSAAAMSCGSDRLADPSPVRFRPLHPSRPRFWRQGAIRTSSRSGNRCEP